MDISLIHEFKQTINTKLDEILLGIIEQYNSEIGKLEEIILGDLDEIVTVLQARARDEYLQAEI